MSLLATKSRLRDRRSQGTVVGAGSAEEGFRWGIPAVQEPNMTFKTFSIFSSDMAAVFSAVVVCGVESLSSLLDCCCLLLVLLLLVSSKLRMEDQITLAEA